MEIHRLVCFFRIKTLFLQTGSAGARFQPEIAKVYPSLTIILSDYMFLVDEMA